MTVHELHDALNLLPGDLITAADRRRMAPKSRTIPWTRIVAVAAGLVLLLGMGMVIRNELPQSPIIMKQSVAEAPAEAAPMAPLPVEQEIAADEAMPEAPAENAMGSSSVTGDENDMEEELCIDHSHRFAEETEAAGSTGAYCGNTVITVYFDGEEHSVGGADSITITKILEKLPYDPSAICRCMAEFTVDTESLAGIEVNLTQAFARCEKGQAALSETQVNTIREILDTLS